MTDFMCTSRMEAAERVPEMIKFMERYYDENINVVKLRMLPGGEMMGEKHTLYDDWDEYTKKDYIKYRLGAACPVYLTIKENPTDKEALDELFGDQQELTEVDFSPIKKGKILHHSLQQ